MTGDARAETRVVQDAEGSEYFVVWDGTEPTAHVACDPSDAVDLEGYR